MPQIKLNMPQPGETITEGTIVNWMVKAGDEVKEGQPVVELETEKAVFEYESPFEGKVLSLLAQANQRIPVGEAIALMEVSDQKAKAYSLLGLIDTPQASPPQEIPVTPPLTKEGLLTPLIRSVLKEHGLTEEEAKKIKHQGPRLTKEDVLAYVSQNTSTGDEGVSLTPASAIRMRIADNMVLSKKTIPHAHTGLTIDMTALLQWREKKGKPNLLSCLFLPLVRAIRDYPLVHSYFLEKGNEKFIATPKQINLGLAMGTEKGLFTPVVSDAASYNFEQANKKIQDLTQRAFAYKLTTQDLKGGTFTFNNYGFFGSAGGIQIVPPGNGAILGMGVIQKRPWVVNDQIVVRSLADFTLSFDHRVMDGRDAGLFLSALKSYLEKP